MLPRWLLIGMLGIIGIHLWKSTVAKEYLRTSIEDHLPMLVFTGAGRSLEEIGTRLKNTLTVERPPQTSQLPTLKLDVPKNTLVKMQRALESGDPELGHDDGGDKPYFKGVLKVDDEKFQRCKICLRGVMQWHHNFDKPSLRIKINKDDHNGGPRYIELTRPEDSLAMKNWLPAKMAEEVGLITENANHVRLFVNNKFYGVYLRTSRQGEPMALLSNRMPGTFFKGDLGGADGFLLGQPGESLWDSAELWKTAGDELEEDKAVFNQFLDLVRQPASRQSIEQLQATLDFEAYAKWSALMIVTGSLHTNVAHNQAYFFSGVRGLVEPIPWDCNSFGIHSQTDSPVDAVLHPVMEVLISDPQWVHRRNELVYEFVNEKFTAEKLKAKIDTEFNKLKADLRADSRLHNIEFTAASWQSAPVSVGALENEKQALFDWIDERYAFLEDYLNDTQLLVQAGQLKVFGHVGVEILQAGESKLLLPGLSQATSIHLSSPAAAEIEIPFVETASIDYELDFPIRDAQFFNAITGEQIFLSDLPEEAEATKRPTRSIRQTFKSRPPATTIQMGPGIVEVSSDLIVSASQTLVFAPGTTVLLGKEIGIYCAGKMKCLGTDSKPIEFRQLKNGSPWAAIAVFGPASSGSKFSNTMFSGGSIGRFQNQRFKGMVNAYHCPSIEMDNCQFGNNFVGDDTVNFAKTDFYVRDCVWRNSKADGLDCDMSKGTIENCRWYASGNDGLDMMTSRITMTRSEFHQSKDKGISVGEQSTLVASDVDIFGCMIGVQIKDDSTAEFTNSRFVDNHAGAHAYQKKWFYSRAGAATFTDCVFQSSVSADIIARKKSQFTLINSRIKTLDGEPNRIHGLELMSTTFVSTDELEEKL